MGEPGNPSLLNAGAPVGNRVFVDCSTLRISYLTRVEIGLMSFGQLGQTMLVKVAQDCSK